MSSSSISSISGCGDHLKAHLKADNKLVLLPTLPITTGFMLDLPSFFSPLERNYANLGKHSRILLHKLSQFRLQLNCAFHDQAEMLSLLKIYNYCLSCQMTMPFPPEQLEGRCLIICKIRYLKLCQTHVSYRAVFAIATGQYMVLFSQGLHMSPVLTGHPVGTPLCQLAPMRSMKY